jgi:hypothetical protein
MKIIFFSIIFVFDVCFAHGLSYPRYGQLLSSHVCNGGVAYTAITADQLDSAAVDFIHLSKKEFDSLPPNDRIAYLVNLYNFNTIVLIKRNYPLKTGIRDISNPWGKAFVPLFGKLVSLDHIEHDMLRKNFTEPRIHFALVCASKSCPPLLSSAYTGNALETQLQSQAMAFLSDTSKNRIQGQTAAVSQIFQWYGKDFEKKHGGFMKFICTTLGIPLPHTVQFIPYDWSLNQVDKCN